MQITLSQILQLKKLEEAEPGQALYNTPAFFLEADACGGIKVWHANKNGIPDGFIGRLAATGEWTKATVIE